jgi:hypothetical protein
LLKIGLDENTDEYRTEKLLSIINYSKIFKIICNAVELPHRTSEALCTVQQLINFIFMYFVMFGKLLIPY